MQVPKTASALVKECIADHLLVVTWDVEAHALCQRLHHPLLCFQVPLSIAGLLIQRFCCKQTIEAALMPQLRTHDVQAAACTAKPAMCHS